MAKITSIGGIPLFNTVREALSWATSRGLTGYHIHSIKGKLGYMGGANHLQANGLPANPNTPIQDSPVNNYTGSGGSRGGGY
tara:strand:+ start:272 stop:517 length:246 start_codon:yes stop_codon:yes gene_type:complete